MAVEYEISGQDHAVAFGGEDRRCTRGIVVQFGEVAQRVGTSPAFAGQPHHFDGQSILPYQSVYPPVRRSGFSHGHAPGRRSFLDAIIRRRVHFSNEGGYRDVVVAPDRHYTQLETDRFEMQEEVVEYGPSHQWQKVFRRVLLFLSFRLFFSSSFFVVSVDGRGVGMFAGASGGVEGSVRVVVAAAAAAEPVFVVVFVVSAVGDGEEACAAGCG